MKSLGRKRVRGAPAHAPHPREAHSRLLANPTPARCFLLMARQFWTTLLSWVWFGEDGDEFDHCDGTSTGGPGHGVGPGPAGGGP